MHNLERYLLEISYLTQALKACLVFLNRYPSIFAPSSASTLAVKPITCKT